MLSQCDRIHLQINDAGGGAAAAAAAHTLPVVRSPTSQRTTRRVRTLVPESPRGGGGGGWSRTSPIHRSYSGSLPPGLAHPALANPQSMIIHHDIPNVSRPTIHVVVASCVYMEEGVVAKQRKKKQKFKKSTLIKKKYYGRKKGQVIPIYGHKIHKRIGRHKFYISWENDKKKFTRKKPIMENSIKHAKQL